jgi:hypothetical protein
MSLVFQNRVIPVNFELFLPNYPPARREIFRDVILFHFAALM